MPEQPPPPRDLPPCPEHQDNQLNCVACSELRVEYYQWYAQVLALREYYDRTDTSKPGGDTHA